MPHRHILTGAPGSGKTALIRHLETLGHDIVEEAATDVISQAQATGVSRPWERPEFITGITALQAFREAALMRSGRRFADRSLFCTIALVEWLGHPMPPDLLEQADRLIATGWFDSPVFFVEQLGFIENTEARRISFDEATRFAAVHRTVYRRYGFELTSVPPASIAERAEIILAALA